MRHVKHLKNASSSKCIYCIYILYKGTLAERERKGGYGPYTRKSESKDSFSV